MAVWEHLNVDKAHIAYAIVGVFSAIFSLVSLFVKEKLYIGETTVAAIVGLIVGPHCLNWFAPTTWGSSDYVTLEISRIVLCLQIFAVAVELPKKYMLKHWLSVVMLLVPVMTFGWLIVGLFMWLLLPGLNFAEALVVSACITATDPVLAAAVVGKGKFARRVPGHLRNLLSAESGCNDGMAFPFIYLGVYLVIHKGNAGEIVKDWICVTILYECILGCLIGVFIGYIGRHSIKFAEKKGIIDRESFLAFYVVLAFTCAGFGAMLGVDDLLVSFAAGAAFSWDGWFSRKTEETHVSTVIDLLLNLSYFVYFGAIIPWPQFNNSELGLDVWRLVVLAIVVIFLRRIPAVMALKKVIPDIKSWREALFCGHFGPIGVGAIFAAILARSELEESSIHDTTPLTELPSEDSKYYHLIAVIWPVVTFLVITSILVHGSSVAVITLGTHLHEMSLSRTKTFSKTTSRPGAGTTKWLSRLPELASGRSFSLQRVDTHAPSAEKIEFDRSNTVETSGVPVKPAGGMERRKKKKRRGLKKIRSYLDEDDDLREKKQREKEAKAAAFALGARHQDETSSAYGKHNKGDELPPHNEEGYPRVGITPATTFNEAAVPFPTGNTPTTTEGHRPTQLETVSDAEEEDLDQDEVEDEMEDEEEESGAPRAGHSSGQDYDTDRRPTNAYQEGNKLIVEDQHGEVIDTARLVDQDRSSGSPDTSFNLKKSRSSTVSSIISPRKSLKRISSSGSSRHRSVAYLAGDVLTLENEDGEVLRRYKIHHHAAKPKNRAGRSSSVINVANKALSAVGLRKSEPKDILSDKVELQKIDPVLEDESSPSVGDDEETEEQIGRGGAIYEETDMESSEEDEDDDEEYDDSADSEDSDNVVSDGDGNEEPETAVEKRRRLAALGQLEDERDEEDEEEDVTSANKTNSAKSKMSAIVGGLKLHPHQEHPDAEESTTTDKSIQFKLDSPKKQI